MKYYIANPYLPIYALLICKTNATLPAYSSWELGYYEFISKNKVFIDGGKGGLLRRVIANKLLVFGNKASKNKNITKLYSLLHVQKAPIFNKEIEQIMQQESCWQVEKMMNSMPEIRSYGAGNWMDLFSLRYRTANANCLTQTIMDNYIQNFMPFIQPSLLKKIFLIPEKIRKKARINQIILSENKALMKFPLVKYDTIIPFELNLYKAYFSAKFYKKFGYYYRSDLPVKFLDNISEYVQDLVRSSDVINYKYYDYKTIKQTVEEYYKGKKENAVKINWWLTFDVWREIISKKSII